MKPNQLPSNADAERGVTFKKLLAPFPYFGGKSRVAAKIWSALGQPAHYLEPFFGSGAVLLARPDYDPAAHTETICDKDGFICNVWRALQFAPDEVVRWCDWPVNHADLMARKKELIKNESRLLENLVSAPEWHDPVLAGYWIWAASCWIGSGLTSPGQRPELGNKGKGVHRTALAGQITHLADKGKGVYTGRGGNIYDYFQHLSARLRRVRVVCGDWERICGGDWQDGNWPTVGVFFDPPYAVKDRYTSVYHHDSTEVAHAVREWAIERGGRDNYRIVITGYKEHADLLDLGWTSETWKTDGGYSKTSRNSVKTQGKDNRVRETIYYSPYCMNKQREAHGSLYDLFTQ